MSLDPRTKHRLLEPGWAGQLTDEELAYIASQLAIDEKLRAKWGFRKRKYYPLDIIRQKAFPERRGEAPRYYKSVGQGGKRFQPGNPFRFKSRVPFADVDGLAGARGSDAKN